MNEQEWFSSSNPVAMLAYLQEHVKPSERKLSLFDAALLARLDTNTAALRASIFLAEDSAKLASNFLRDIFGNPWRPATLPWITEGIPRREGDGDTAVSIIRYCPWLTWHDATIVKLAQAAYDERAERKCERCGGDGNAELHPIGNGAWSGACEPCGGTGTISDGTLDPDRLAVLADALEEAGCTDEDMLRHLRGWDFRQCCEGGCIGEWVRSDAPHVRGCWVVDLLLGKE